MKLIVAAWLVGFAAVAASAAPVVPSDDDEVVETLPAGASRGEDRRLRRQLAARPLDAAMAVEVARRHLERARALGDPREAGVALAALRAWPEPSKAPPEVVLLQATIAQHLHDFEGASSRLEALVVRAPRMAQAWLTLATLRRVQGRYAASDAACGRLASLGASLHAAACRAENDGLRGRFGPAREALHSLAATPGLDAATRGWLLTSRAELEQRAGRVAAAESAWTEALRAGPDPYTAIGFADFLVAQGRWAQAITVLEPYPASDAVLLRRAIAARRAGLPGAAAQARELRQRFETAGLRPGAQAAHGREQAMFALWVEPDAARALDAARRNLEVQREPIDLWLLVQAARAAGRAEDVRAARALAHEIGLRDLRLEEEG